MSKRRKKRLKKKILITFIVILFVGLGAGLYLSRDSISNLFNNKDVANSNDNDNKENVNETMTQVVGT